MRTDSNNLKKLFNYSAKIKIQLTPLRKDVLQVICDNKQPLTAYQILRQLREIRANAEPPTVYRVLEFLENNHLVHKIETTNTYISCVHPEIPHANQILLCNSCGDAIEIHDAKLALALKKSAQVYGFILGPELTEIRGKCTNCHS